MTLCAMGAYLIKGKPIHWQSMANIEPIRWQQEHLRLDLAEQWKALAQKECAKEPCLLNVRLIKVPAYKPGLG